MACNPNPDLDLSTRRFMLPHINPEGWKFAIAAFFIGWVVPALPAVLSGHPLALAYVSWFPFALAYAVALFFRDPERVDPSDERALVSPADGYVCLIQRKPIPEELREAGEAAGAERWRISIFMSVLDIHVNRMPFTGEILKKVHVPGRFLNASVDEASDRNERELYRVRSAAGDYAFVQIAGLVARRIVPFVETGAKLVRGERFGLIRFGSRLDVYLPEGVEPMVKIGQRMLAGESILARV